MHLRLINWARANEGGIPGGLGRREPDSATLSEPDAAVVEQLLLQLRKVREPRYWSARAYYLSRWYEQTTGDEMLSSWMWRHYRMLWRRELASTPKLATPAEARMMTARRWHDRTLQLLEGIDLGKTTAENMSSLGGRGAPVALCA